MGWVQADPFVLFQPHQAIPDALGVQLLTRSANKSYFTMKDGRQEMILDIFLAIYFTT